MPINNNTFSQTYPQTPQIQQPLPPMPSNMPTQPFPNGEFNQMPNANFPNNPYPQQMPPQKKSNSGCLIVGLIIGCLSIVILCFGILVYLYMFSANLVTNIGKPMIKTFAFLNDVCEIKVTDEDKKAFMEKLKNYGFEEKDILVSLKPKDFYDTAFSQELKSKYSYEEFIKDIQPITSSSNFCDEYYNKLQNAEFPAENNPNKTNMDGAEIVWGSYGGYIIRTVINPTDGLITEFKVEKSDQQNYDDNRGTDNNTTNNDSNRRNR